MYCGKCGSKLNSRGKCPVCNSPGKKPIWLVVLAVILILGVLAAAIWMQRTGTGRLGKPDETAVPEIQTEAEATEAEPESAADVFLREQILPQFGAVRNSLTLPYLSYLYIPEDNSYSAGGTYYEIDRGPIALLATEKKDYDHNGVDDLLVISLSAHAPDLEIVNACWIPSGMNDLYLDLRVYYFDTNGRCMRDGGAGFQLSANGKETAAFCAANNRLLYLESYDESAGYDFDVPAYYAVTDELTGHSDEVTAYDLSGKDKVKSDYAAYRKSHFGWKTQKAFDVDYIVRGEIDHENEVYCWANALVSWTRSDMGVLLYCAQNSPNLTDESNGIYIDNDIGVAGFDKDMSRTEEDICARITKSLNALSGANPIRIAPVGVEESWETRWKNTFAPDITSDALLCMVSMEATEAQPQENGLIGGTMTLQIEKTTK